MKKLALALSLACLFASASARAQNAYITNAADNTVSVIDTATNTVIGSPITVGSSSCRKGFRLYDLYNDGVATHNKAQVWPKAGKTEGRLCEVEESKPTGR